MPHHDFPWPPIDLRTPAWTGAGFRVADVAVPVLCYEAGPSGWSESLTTMHEDAAGAGTHPVDIASRRHARTMLKRHLQTPPAEAVILEAGCSSGWLLQDLVVDWPESLVIGSDFILGPLERLATTLTRVPLLQFDLVKCPLPTARVDAVVLLNVLEHIEDDQGAVAQVARILRPGGLVVLEVPAGPELYDVYDKHLQHYRRYRLRDVCRLVEGAGLDVVDQSHLGFFVYPMFALIKRRNRRLLDAPPEIQQASVVNSIRQSGSNAGGGLLTLAMGLERALEPWVRYPVGIRCVVTARKTG
jgi:SAM-dependent methyltransferase